MKEYSSLKDDSPLSNMLSEERIALLRQRGFCVPSPFEVDDHFYKSEYDRGNHSFLKSKKSINELISMSCEEMKEELFKKDSVYAQEVAFNYGAKRFYNTFGRDKMFFDVTPDCLDPFVAGYVRAINRCGMRTFFSCDGWHRVKSHSKTVAIMFEDRYSCIWHKMLCECVYLPDGIRWEHNNDDSGGSSTINLPDDDEGKKAIYKGIWLLAEEFNKNMRFFQTLKIYLISKIDYYRIDLMTGSEVEECFNKEISQICSNKTFPIGETI